MSEEKEVVPETNGTEENVEDTNNKEPIVEESNAEEDNQKENIEDCTDLDAEIIRQVEYYFGDVNLPRDKFLREQIRLDNGWVPLNILMRFNRLSKLSPDIEVIEKALRKATSGLLEIEDKKVRRNPEQPVPEMNEDRRKEIASRTIYAKGFPKNSSLDEILAFFKQYKVVENVIMRRYLDLRTKIRQFKGSVFATFKTKEQADKFMEDKDIIKYKDTNLQIMWQDEYGVVKQGERDERHKKKEKKMKQANAIKPMAPLPTGTVLYFEDGHEKMTREEIKSACTKIDKKCDVAFIDFKIGLTKGWIRFSQENAAKEFLSLLEDDKMMIGEHKVLLKMLEGDEEQAYLEKTVDEMYKRRKNMKNYRPKGRNAYKVKQMKRKREDDKDDGPPSKVKCDS